MSGFDELKDFLVELKKSGQLSKKDEERVDEFIRFLEKKQKRFLIKALVIAARILWNYFKD